VLIHHFFRDADSVPDNKLLPIATAVLDHKHPRDWYSALMDYGTMLKKEHGNLSRRSAHYTKQSRFEGSRRQVRGRVLKTLLAESPLSRSAICILLNVDMTLLMSVLNDLIAEEIIIHKNRKFSI